MKLRLALILPLALALSVLAHGGPILPPDASPLMAQATPPAAGAVAGSTTSATPPSPIPQPRLSPPGRPIRALQVLNLNCANLAEMDSRFAEWRQAGARAIIVRVFHNPGDGYYRFVKPAHDSGVYFKTSHLPVVADALTPMLEAAHKNGLIFIAWMTSRYADYGGGSNAGHGCMKWEPGTGIIPSRGWSVLMPDVADRLALIYADLARYPIDGVLIQDDLMLHHTEDMNPAVRALYTAETGRSAEPSALFFNDRGRVGYRDGFLDWRRWENQKLLALASRLRTAVQAVRPRTPVGLNFYYENVTDPANALVWFAQDLNSTMQTDLDFYALMLYHRQVARELKISDAEAIGLIERGLRPLARRVDRPQRLWVKAQSVDWETGRALPSAQVTDLLGRARALGPLGLVIMPAPPDLDLGMVKETFK